MDAQEKPTGKGTMPGKGSDSKPKRKFLAAPCTEQEHAFALAETQRTGKPIAQRIRAALLNDPAPRARREPTINRRQTACLIATLGELAQALRDAAKTGDQSATSAQIEAAHRDIADLSLAARQALGRRS